MSETETERDLEFDWIKGLIDQISFAQKNMKYYHPRLVVKRYCDCWPNCYSDVDVEEKTEVAA